jgi:hypothetical protein
MHMKRRYLLLSGLAAACGLAGWRFATSSEQAAIVKVVYKKLGYLKLDAGGVQRFARDLAATQTISSARLRITDAVGPLYTGPAFSGDNKPNNAIRHGEDRVVTLYLLSSDFFKNGADQNRTVYYQHYYDPMIACGNPFARPVIIPTPA